MSGQRSDWRERLHANPSRMEQELAIKLQENRINVLVSDHRSACYSLVWSRVVERPGDPFASLDLAVLGSAHVVSGLSCWGRVMSDVVGSGWTHVRFLRTVGGGSPGLASFTPLSGGGSGASRVLFFVLLSHRSRFSQ